MIKKRKENRMKMRMIMIMKMRMKMSFRKLINAVSIVLVTCALYSVFIYTNNFTTNYLINKINDTALSNLDQIVNKFEFNMSEVIGIVRNLAQSEQLIEYIRKYYNKNYSYERMQAQKEILSIFEKMKNFNNNIDTIALLVSDNTISSGSISFYDYSLNTFKKERAVYEILKKNRTNPYVFEKVLSREINDKYFRISNLYDNVSCASIVSESNIEFGIILVIMKSDYIDNLYNNNKHVAILNNKFEIAHNGTECSSDDILKIKKQLIDNDQFNDLKIGWKKLRIMHTRSNLNNWEFMYIINENEILGQVNKFRYYSLILTFASFLIMLLLSRSLIRRLAGPLETIISKIERFRNTNNNSEEASEILIDRPARQMTLREKLMYYFILVVFIPVLSYLITYNIIAIGSIRGKILETNRIVFQQVSENVNDYLVQKLRIVDNIIYNNDIQRFLVNSSDENYRKSSRSIVDSTILMGKGHMDIELYDNNINIIYKNSDKKIQSVLDKTFTETTFNFAKIQWLPSKSDAYGEIKMNMFFKIKDIGNFNNSVNNSFGTIGFLKAEIDEMQVEKIYDSLNNSQMKCFIVDSKGFIISHPDKNMIGNKSVVFANANANAGMIKKAIEGEQKLIMTDKIKGTPLYLACVFDYDKMINESREIFSKSIFILFIILLVVLLISYILSFSFIKNISQINQIFNSMGFKSSTYDRLPEMVYISEIEELNITFNKMVMRIENLIDEVLMEKIALKGLEEEKKYLEIQALQAQINPHFLCNTLETIRCLIDEKDNAKASLMMHSLNNLFKYGISRDEPLITIEQELTYTRSYLMLINIRFTNQLDLNWDIDDNILDYKTLKLVLQPLVENSINHGIKDKKGEKSISISCKKDGERIKITVADNGKGIEKNTLQKINNNLKNNILEDRIGLANVNRRIKVYYGSAYGLDLVSLPGKGTKVSLYLPLNY